jgi:hypothetical protein
MITRIISTWNSEWARQPAAPRNASRRDCSALLLLRSGGPGRRTLDPYIDAQTSSASSILVGRYWHRSLGEHPADQVIARPFVGPATRRCSKIAPRLSDSRDAFLVAWKRPGRELAVAPSHTMRLDRLSRSGRHLGRNLAADRRTAAKTGSSVGNEGVECVITGGVCLNDEEKHQIGSVENGPGPRPTSEAVQTPPYGFRYPSRMVTFTPIPGHLGNVGIQWQSGDRPLVFGEVGHGLRGSLSPAS